MRKALLRKIVLAMFFCSLISTMVPGNIGIANNERSLTTPRELEKVLSNFDSDLELLENYSTLILSYQDLSLPKSQNSLSNSLKDLMGELGDDDESIAEIADFLDDVSDGVDKVNEILPEYQRSARNNARVWMYNVYPQLFETIRLVIEYAEEFDESSRELYDLIPEIEKDDDQAKEKFEGILNDLLGGIESKRPMVEEVVSTLQAFRSVVLNDAQNLGGVQDILDDFTNQGGGVVSSFWDVYDDLDAKEKAYRENGDRILRISGSWEAAEPYYKKEDAVKDFKPRWGSFASDFESQHGNISSLLDEISPIVQMVSDTTNILQKNIVGGWEELESRVGGLIRGINWIDSDFLDLLEEDLDLAVGNWRNLKDVAESLQAFEDPRDDRPDPPTLDYIGIYYTTFTSIGIEWSNEGDTPEEVEKWIIYRDNMEIATIEDYKVTQYKDENLFPNEKYTYRVQPVNVLGDREEDRTEISFSTRNLYPPENIKDISRTSTTVTLEWDPAPTFDGVTLEYDIYQMEGNKVIGSTTETNFTVEGLEPSTNYAFTVKAREENRSSRLDSILMVQTAPTERTLENFVINTEVISN
ncbi:HBL/NHE enterotoxin family protein [Jeotgalibacillus marinus]|uniref:HBL/NHE enterotoxin family protein n=1 Tax=Jeotgalibacillus marinus TaxID=86667 RepID=A0ABV3Q370_9BACL